MREISFYKYHGDGNDFVIIDDRDLFFPSGNKKLIEKKICKRCFGIGADGLVLLQKPTLSTVDIKMRIFNSDGSEAESCGNALSCTVAFLKDHLFSKPKYQIETKAGIVAGFIENDRVSIEMTNPIIISKKKKLSIDKRNFIYYHINSGVPHVVIFEAAADQIDVDHFGKKIRQHKVFSPSGANVNFAKLYKDGVFLRTFEKGVEGETFSCGTGAVATAIASFFHFDMPSPVNLYFRNSKKKVSFNNTKKNINKVVLNSCVNFVYKGIYFC